MNRYILAFLLLLSVGGFVWADSELTLGGKTGAAHIIMDDGTALKPRPYLDFTTNIVCIDEDGRTKCSSTGGSGSINWDDPAALAAIGWVNDVAKLYVADAGDNVGIGTTLPTAKLHIGTANKNAMPITGADLYVKGNIEFDGKIYGDGSQLSNLPAAGTTDHSALDNLAYADSGHTGFQPAGSYLTAVASDSDWTVHASYPSACSAGSYVTAIGDTLTCSTPSGSGDMTKAVYDTNSNNVVDTATALAANGSNCASGYYPKGVDASGAVEDCVLIDSTVYQVAGSYLTSADIDTSSELATIMTDEVGTGFYVLNASPYFTGNVGVGTTVPLTPLSVVGITQSTQFKTPTFSADPAIFTDSDSNTGLVFSAPDILSLDTGGAVAMTINATQNIGVGTTAPANKLEVVGTVKATAFTGNLTGAVTGNASTASALAANGANCSAGQAPLGVDASGAVEGCFTPTDTNTTYTASTGITLTGTAFSTNDGQIVHDSLSGFVANEHIDWTSDQGATNIHAGNYTDTNTNASTICSGTTTYLDGEGNCDDISSVYQATLGTTSSISIGTATVAANIATATLTTSGNVGIGTTDVSRPLTVKGTGNVGIGTTAPIAALHVVGDIYAESAGNLGIGTTSPLAKLHVDGTIYSKNMTAGGNHGAAKAICLGLDGMIYSISSGSCY